MCFFGIPVIKTCVDPIGDLIAADLVVVSGGPIGVYQTDLYPFLAGDRLGAGQGTRPGA